jgi:hypothetical protein
VKTINFVLKQKGKGYYFSNPKTDSENEIFYNKEEGVHILMEYVANQMVSKCKALELIDQITSLTEFPASRKVKSHQLTEDIASLLLILKIKKDLQQFSVTETEKDLPKLKMCENCGKHGQIIGEEFLSVELVDRESAEEALEELFGHGRINRVERDKIKIQIDDSDLPSKLHQINPQMN